MKNRIFLVDDEEISNLLNKKILEAEGVEAIFEDFLDSKKAFETLKDRAEESFPDLLIIDLRMPYLNGLDFLEALQKTENIKLCELKAIVLSSSLNLSDKEKAISLPNVLEFMQKPLDAQKVNLIKEYLKKLN